MKILIQKAFECGVAYSQDRGYMRDLEIVYHQNYKYSIRERTSYTDAIAYGKTLHRNVDILDIKKVLEEALNEKM